MGIFDYNPNGTKLINSDQLINIGFEKTISHSWPKSFIKSISCEIRIDPSNKYISVFKVYFFINCDEQGNICRNKNGECVINVKVYDRFDKIMDVLDVYVFGKYLSDVGMACGISIPLQSKEMKFYCSEVETLLSMMTPEWCTNFIQDNIDSIAFANHQSSFSMSHI